MDEFNREDDFLHGDIPFKQDCPCCGASEPEYFYLDENEICIGCTECVYKVTELY